MRNLAVTTMLAFAVMASGQQPTQTAGQTPAAQPSQSATAQTSQAPTAQPSQSPATQAAQTPSAQSGQTQPGGTSASQKVIKDPAEYNAYVTALNIQDPAARAAAMEAFVKQYPQSVVLADGLEQAMKGYSDADNKGKLEETAKRILQITPNNVPALAIVVALDRTRSNGGESCGDASKGVQELANWQKPDGLSDADYELQRKQITGIFDRAAGSCALQNKDFAAARSFYQKVFDPVSLEDTSQLALADLQMNPIDLSGFWYGAKAMSLPGADPHFMESFSKFVKGQYRKYHGQSDDWDKFAAAVSAQSSPPSPAAIAVLIPPAPTPCEVAVDILRKYKPEDLSLRDRAFILSQANCSSSNLEAAEKVWQSIQAMEKDRTVMLLIPVKVISATTTSVDVAIVDDENKSPDKADVHVQLRKPLPKPPAPGTVTKVRGFITKYTADPFMFTMEQGTLLAQTAPAPKQHGRAAPKPMG